jgi:hypothetical protein
MNSLIKTLESHDNKISLQGVRITHHEIENTSVEDIKDFTAIANYPPTYSLHPTLVKTQNGVWIIDGSEKVEEARRNGEKFIKSEIFVLNYHSDAAIALMKTASRAVPRGGKVPYIFRISNAFKCLNYLINSNENLELLSHGGDRKGHVFGSSRESDALALLAEHLEKDRDTVSAYVNHGRYLTDAALEILQGMKPPPPKLFFDLIQVEKSTLVKQLMNMQASIPEISQQISKAVTDWFKEYQTTEKIIFASTTAASQASGVKAGQKKGATANPGKNTPPGPQTTPAPAGPAGSAKPLTPALIRSPAEILLAAEITKIIDGIEKSIINTKAVLNSNLPLNKGAIVIDATQIKTQAEKLLGLLLPPALTP